MRNQRYRERKGLRNTVSGKERDIVRRRNELLMKWGKSWHLKHSSADEENGTKMPVLLRRLQLRRGRSFMKKKCFKLQNCKNQKQQKQLVMNVKSRILQHICEEERNDTSPLLLLSPAIVPIAEPSCSCTNTVVAARCKELLEDVRRERNNAIMLARGYRDMTEQCQTEKQKLKYKLEEKVAVVRNFWQNSVLEGSSRSG